MKVWVGSHSSRIQSLGDGPSPQTRLPSCEVVLRVIATHMHTRVRIPRKRRPHVSLVRRRLHHDFPFQFQRACEFIDNFGVSVKHLYSSRGPYQNSWPNPSHGDLTGFLIGEVTDLLLLFEVQSQHEQIFGGRAVREHQSIFRCHKFAHVHSIGVCS
jgi:hypothetical protein